MQHGRLLKKDKKKIIDIIEIMDDYKIANQGEVQDRLGYLNNEIYRIEVGMNKPYSYRRILKECKKEKECLIEVISVMQRYDSYTRNDLKKELDKISENRNQVHKRHLGIIIILVMSLCIPAAKEIKDIVGGEKSVGNSEEKEYTDTNNLQKSDEKNKLNKTNNVYESYDLTEYEINQFITSYNDAYTEAIANKTNLDKKPSDYFEGIIVEDSPYRELLNEYIKNHYDINRYEFTANYKDAIYYKEKGILLINHAVIDSKVKGGDKIRRPEGEVNRAAFEIEVKYVDGNKKILIKDKLKNEEIDSRLGTI